MLPLPFVVEETHSASEEVNVRIGAQNLMEPSRFGANWHKANHGLGIASPPLVVGAT